MIREMNELPTLSGYKYCIKSDGCFFKSIIWEFPKWFSWNFIHQEYDPETLHPFMKRMKCRFLDDLTKANSPSYSIWMIIGPATPRWQDVRWNINTNPGIGPSLKRIYIKVILYRELDSGEKSGCLGWKKGLYTFSTSCYRDYSKAILGIPINQPGYTIEIR